MLTKVRGGGAGEGGGRKNSIKLMVQMSRDSGEYSAYFFIFFCQEKMFVVLSLLRQAPLSCIHEANVYRKESTS